MRVSVFSGVVLAACQWSVANAQQASFAWQKPVEEQHYEFEWPIRKVAIIGAGVGGLVAYRELAQAGFDVRVFERDHAPGGNWHYSDQKPPVVDIPNVAPVDSDYVPDIPDALPHGEVYLDSSADDTEERIRNHRGPKPTWASLDTNTPSVLQEIPGFKWPARVPLATDWHHVQRYLRAFASWHDINVNDDGPISYNTRVDRVEKRADGKGWTLTLKELVQTGDHTAKASWYTEDFDAVVIASGRFNGPSVPDIAGLAEFSKKFPGRIIHSREYRRPAEYEDQTVLVVGAGSSAVGIARDIIHSAKQVLQSIRRPTDPLRRYNLSTLPANATVIPTIDSIDVGRADSPSDARIHLSNGTVISGVDRIVLATGFRYTYPYLPQYHQSDKLLNNHPLVTDGTHVQSLFLDLFYIEEPTIGFINVNERIPTFSHSSLTASALASVWAGRAKLPNTEEQWRLHGEYVQRRGGYDKEFQRLPPDVLQERKRLFVAWLNDAAVQYGGPLVTAYDDHAEIMKLWQAARYNNTFDVLYGEQKSSEVAAFIG
ncbi:FAD/NAD(P)-binding domain-containing protein [Cylindrobasidium torrendii FP15055 ss-10]|uniref:FAD/NAD(P)-binding domain-containing protein n=1 Tax=Cylindrobasidium torrendii FP15055 ss-10 TaxID=1314674 RepID=A0A0D7B2H4_9AGAR|nr:FAD/NAD(P)-binding domain-containing protein [Cylindrobasidium torrendii FP15055 ss-10]